jgi:tripartite-type tricarboxylate transporter receptor subunit TctC
MVQYHFLFFTETVSQHQPSSQNTDRGALSSPTHTPESVVEKLGNLIRNALQNAKTREALSAAGITPALADSHNLTSILRAESDRYS